ncbi:hypothetical protein NWFMUON74_40680 [Nocardia wallacei]|uniref:Uncharacterized protein n=1 Tax=Nocardia wallacei TaxID=480035 RepID=A0A7G1KP32_9NOCA|nr:hypothetical protein NWFMUON74_40370 [Nocardia wallacei]BCK56296.1 hypothetical protein NWFMUON74_40680 [Nocardia wallacei]
MPAAPAIGTATRHATTASTRTTAKTRSEGRISGFGLHGAVRQQRTTIEGYPDTSITSLEREVSPAFVAAAAGHSGEARR